MLLTSCATVKPIPVLVYHQIALAPPRGAAFRSLYVSPDAFSRQLQLLKILGYRGLSMSALLPYLMGEKTGKVVGITFDDGFLNNLTQALPVLQRFDFSSTCYVVSQRLGQFNDWDKGSGIAPAPLMDAAQLRAWVAGGQEVGAHTRHHVHLPRLSDIDSALEIKAGKVELERAIGRPVQHFCYPYGEYLPAHVPAVRNAGFFTATTTQRSRCLAGHDFLQLPRVPVVRSTTLLMLWMKLATRYEDRRSNR
jgi:peptidoglycan/xylan/chitin deacetylase (PgdA/CDA1 family)